MRTITVNAEPTTTGDPGEALGGDPGEARGDTLGAPLPPEPVTESHDAATTTELGLSLQLSRASLMALTRLQLAIQSGDRQQTMAAMDRLHALDAEMERLVASLPPPRGSQAEWSAIAKHVNDQKLAIAFDKLALVSEISGPDMVSTPAIPLSDAGEEPTALPDRPVEDVPPLPDWPVLPEVEPTEWKSIPSGVLGLALALLVTAAIAAAVVLMTAV